MSQIRLAVLAKKAVSTILKGLSSFNPGLQNIFPCKFKFTREDVAKFSDKSSSGSSELDSKILITIMY
jgi:hypothetical protein